MNPQQKDFDPHTCNKCGAKADLGFTCVGPRCRQCGCDNARPENDEPDYLFFNPVMGVNAVYYGDN